MDRILNTTYSGPLFLRIPEVAKVVMEPFTIASGICRIFSSMCL
jgi:hypothetical protein